MSIKEKWLRTVREVLDDLLPAEDEDAVFRKEAAEAHIKELMAPPNIPSEGAQPEVAWVIERGGLCLGFCEHQFAWVTFTDDKALRFSRAKDAYGFMETVKWKPYNLHLENSIVTEHLWG